MMIIIVTRMMIIIVTRMMIIIVTRMMIIIVDDFYQSDTDDDYYSDNDIEDFTWMKCCVAESTWKVTDEGVRTSTRQRYQQRPLL
jgi:hypothetical protein